MKTSILQLVAVFFIITATATVVSSSSTADEKYKAAVDARALVNASSWGVVSNIDLIKGKAPFGNAVSFSDGGLGTPFFYLTIKDQATANFSLYDSRSSLTVSQYALGTCGMRDPQEPACVKVTLSGTLKKLKPRSREGRFANATLFQRHPRFSMLPSYLNFELYKLEIKNVFVLNTYGDPKFPSVSTYLSVKL